MNDAPEPGDLARNRLMTGLGLTLVAAAIAMFLNQTLVFAAGVSLALVLSVALGASKRGTLGPFRSYLFAALAVWWLAFAGMHLLPHSTDTLVLGFPPATAVAIYGLWLAPFFVVTLPYALHFDRFILTAEDWKRLEPYARRDGDRS
jgi:hypothetical protein